MRSGNGAIQRRRSVDGPAGSDDAAAGVDNVADTEKDSPTAPVDESVLPIACWGLLVNNSICSL